MESRADQRLSRVQRRLLVATMYLGLAAYVVTSFFENSWWWLFVGLSGFVATLAIHSSMLAPFTQRIADEKESKLDERQLVIRNRAHRTAYQILGATVILALLYTHFSLTYFDKQLWVPEITTNDLSTITMGTIWLVVTLPTAIIAWSEPNPEPESEGESLGELERGASR